MLHYRIRLYINNQDWIINKHYIPNDRVHILNNLVMTPALTNSFEYKNADFFYFTVAHFEAAVACSGAYQYGIFSLNGHAVDNKVIRSFFFYRNGIAIIHVRRFTTGRNGIVRKIWNLRKIYSAGEL